MSSDDAKRRWRDAQMRSWRSNEVTPEDEAKTELTAIVDKMETLSVQEQPQLSEQHRGPSPPAVWLVIWRAAARALHFREQRQERRRSQHATERAPGAQRCLFDAPPLGVHEPVVGTLIVDDHRALSNGPV